MKQKKINDILYVFDFTPYEITQDTDAEVIKVQEESYAGFIDLNESLADKIVKYNYNMMTVQALEWAPYANAPDGPVLEITGTDILTYCTIEFDGVTQENQQYYYDVTSGTVIDIYPSEDPENYELISGATWSTDHWTATMGDEDLTITINYTPQPIVTGHTLTLDGNDLISNITVEFDSVQQQAEFQYQDVAEGTVIDITPTQDSTRYTLITGATWDTDHWTATMPDEDLTIEINYTEPAPQPTADKFFIVPKMDGANPLANKIYDTEEENYIENLPYYSCNDMTDHYDIMLIAERAYEIDETNLAYTVELYYDDQYTEPVTTEQGVLGPEFTYDSSDIAIHAKVTAQPSYITLTAPYGLEIMDDTITELVTMTQDQSDPDIATGTITTGHSLQINQAAGAGYEKWPIFIPAVSLGTFGALGEQFTAPATDLTITLDNDANVQWSSNTATVTIGADDNVFPTLSNSNNYTPSYSSSDQNAATIDSSTGAITLVAEGQTTITATIAGYGNTSSSVTYTLNIRPDLS